MVEHEAHDMYLTDGSFLQALDQVNVVVIRLNNAMRIAPLKRKLWYHS